VELFIFKSGYYEQSVGTRSRNQKSWENRYYALPSHYTPAYKQCMKSDWVKSDIATMQDVD